MQITIAKSAGFCFGVKRALDIAYKATSSGKKIEMLGDIVHNEDVVKQINDLGIKKVSRLSSGKNKTILIRAHGADKKLFKKAIMLGYSIIDATCPMVKEIHKIATDMENKGFKIIIIGDKKHDEVHGIIGQLKNKALVIEHLDEATINKVKRLKKACIICQSTQKEEKVFEIVSKIRPFIKEMKFFNTICMPTRIKQKEIKLMPLENDLMLIIGSKNSANTKRLFEISKTLNANSFWVQSSLDINPKWFQGINKVGITAGASTPDETTNKIVARIKQIGKNN